MTRHRSQTKTPQRQAPSTVAERIDRALREYQNVRVFINDSTPESRKLAAEGRKVYAAGRSTSFTQAYIDARLHIIQRILDGEAKR